MLATQMHEAMFENSAAKIFIELARDEAWKPAALFGELAECGPRPINILTFFGLMR
jgi:hypothetical protein